MVTDETLPDPLVPAEVVLRDFQHVPIDAVRMRDSKLITMTNGEEFKSWMLLLCAAWHQEPAGSLPDDDAELALLAGYGRFPKEWRKVRTGALYGWVKCSDGRLYHPVLAEKAIAGWRAKEETAHRRDRDRFRKSAGKDAWFPDFDVWNEARISSGTGLEFRWKPKTVPTEPPGDSGGTPPEPSSSGGGKKPDSTPKEKGTEGKGEGTEGNGTEGNGRDFITPPPEPPEQRPPRATRLGLAALPDEWREDCRRERPDLDPDAVWPMFADHWRAKPGKDGAKLDWRATWRNWCRREKPGGFNGRGKTERNQAAIDEFLARGEAIEGHCERVDDAA